MLRQSNAARMFPRQSFRTIPFSLVAFLNVGKTLDALFVYFWLFLFRRILQVSGLFGGAIMNIFSFPLLKKIIFWTQHLLVFPEGHIFFFLNTIKFPIKPLNLPQINQILKNLLFSWDGDVACSI